MGIKNSCGTCSLNIGNVCGVGTCPYKSIKIDETPKEEAVVEASSNDLEDTMKLTKKERQMIEEALPSMYNMIAKKYGNYGKKGKHLQLADLMSIGYLEACQKIKDFDPSKNVKSKTFILASVKSGVHNYYMRTLLGYKIIKKTVDYLDDNGIVNNDPIVIEYQDYLKMKNEREEKLVWNTEKITFEKIGNKISKYVAMKNSFNKFVAIDDEELGFQLKSNEPDMEDTIEKNIKINNIMKIIKTDLSEYQKEVIHKIYYENKSLRDTEEEIKLELEKIKTEYEQSGDIIRYETISSNHGLKREFFKRVQTSKKTPDEVFKKMNNRAWYEHQKILGIIKTYLGEMK